MERAGCFALLGLSRLLSLSMSNVFGESDCVRNKSKHVKSRENRVFGYYDSGA